MIDEEKRKKVMRGLDAHANPKTCETCAGEECPYYNEGGSYPKVTCSSILAADALALLKEQEKEIKALRKLLDWAIECDFGIDNLGDWWTERFAEEIEGMGYKESLIHLAKRYIEVFEGGDNDV